MSEQSQSRSYQKRKNGLNIGKLQPKNSKRRSTGIITQSGNQAITHDQFD